MDSNLTILLFFIVFCIVIYSVFSCRIKNANNPESSPKASIPQSASAKKASSKNKANTGKRSRVVTVDGEKVALDMSMIPSKVDIDDDFLPFLIKRKYGYGKRFNAFVIDGEPCFHKGNCTSVKGKKKRLLHRYIAAQRYVPCDKCTPNTKIDSWYIEFLKKNPCLIKSTYAAAAADLESVTLPETSGNYIVSASQKKNN